MSKNLQQVFYAYCQAHPLKSFQGPRHIICISYLVLSYLKEYNSIIVIQNIRLSYPSTHKPVHDSICLHRVCVCPSGLSVGLRVFVYCCFSDLLLMHHLVKSLFTLSGMFTFTVKIFRLSPRLIARVCKHTHTQIHTYFLWVMQDNKMHI